MNVPSFSLGIEEEYLLVSRATRNLAADPPPGLLKECETRLAPRVTPELLRSQIEVQTGICDSLDQARGELAHMRKTVAEVAGQYGFAPIAVSTHPFGQWDEQMTTEKERYEVIARDLGQVGRRLVICGLHVHVGIEDEELRLDLLNQVTYFLPHLLALSTSSPFWRGADTGHRSYRLSVFNELPRTGLPEYFDSYGEYQRHIRLMIQAGVIEDASKIWWDVRASARFPTLEMRIPDMCTRLEDALTIAALYRSLLRMLWRLRRNNQRWRTYARMLIGENRWRAQRYGTDEGLVDFGKGAVIPFAQLLEEMIELVREDAEALGCLAEVENARNILRRGTSAHVQLSTYHAALAAGSSNDEAMAKVVDWLIAETLQGV